MEAKALSKQDLLNRLHQHQAELRALGVERLGLFGSFRHERQTPDSDVDLLVQFALGEKTFRNYMNLTILLEDLLGRPVELLTEDALSPHIGPHILDEVEYVSV